MAKGSAKRPNSMLEKTSLSRVICRFSTGYEVVTHFSQATAAPAQRGILRGAIGDATWRNNQRYLAINEDLAERSVSRWNRREAQALVIAG